MSGFVWQGLYFLFISWIGIGDSQRPTWTFFIWLLHPDRSPLWYSEYVCYLRLSETPVYLCARLLYFSSTLSPRLAVVIVELILVRLKKKAAFQFMVCFCILHPYQYSPYLHYVFIFIFSRFPFILVFISANYVLLTSICSLLWPLPPFFVGSYNLEHNSSFYSMSLVSMTPFRQHVFIHFTGWNHFCHICW